MWQTFLANVAGGSKRVSENGIDYLVSPISLMTPGVRTSAANGLNVLYNEENLKKNAAAWNGVPALAGHPKVTAPTGDVLYVSAQHEDFADKKFGELRSVTYCNGLRGELWIVIEKAATLAPGLVNQLEAGTKVEISIGAGGTVKSWNGTYEGTNYNVVAQDLQPDHVAVLMNGVGACSISKGCGLNNESLDHERFLNLYRIELANRGLSEIQIHHELSHWQIQWELRDQLVARFTQAEPSVWIEDVYDDHFIFSQNGELFQLSYTKSDSGVTIGSEDPVEVTRDVNFIPVTNEETNMSKKELVTWLINNSCGCWKKGDETALMAFSDEKLAELKTSAENHQLLVNEKKVPTSLTRDQWFAQAPVDVKQTVEYANQLHNEARTTLINQLVATTTLDDANKTTLAAELAKRNLDDLRLINNIITHQIQKSPTPPQQPLFAIPANGGFINPFASLVNQQAYKDGVNDTLPDQEIVWGTQSVAR